MDKLKTYTAVLHHDNGVVTLTTVAISAQKALDTITAAEGCPVWAVEMITDTTVITKN